MNHVPDAVLDEIDAFGKALLAGPPPRIDGRLRSDLRLRIVPDRGENTAVLSYETDHTKTPPTIRDRGPFVTTIVDGVDSRLRSWGVTPPAAYEHVETVDGTHTYSGQLRLP